MEQLNDNVDENKEWGKFSIESKIWEGTYAGAK